MIQDATSSHATLCRWTRLRSLSCWRKRECLCLLPAGSHCHLSVKSRWKGREGSPLPDATTSSTFHHTGCGVAMRMTQLLQCYESLRDIVTARMEERHFPSLPLSPRQLALRVLAPLMHMFHCLRQSASHCLVVLQCSLSHSPSRCEPPRAVGLLPHAYAAGDPRAPPLRSTLCGAKGQCRHHARTRYTTVHLWSHSMLKEEVGVGTLLLNLEEFHSFSENGRDISEQLDWTCAGCARGQVSR